MTTTKWNTLRQVTPKEVSEVAVPSINPKALAQAKDIMDQVKAEGEAALIRIAVSLGDLKSPDAQFIYTSVDMATAYAECTDEQKQLLESMAQNIKTFAIAQRASITSTSVEIPGGVAGQNVDAMKTAGCYAPGGRYPLPSSVLMTAITARVAGVSNVVVASPHPGKIMLAAAHVAGADIFLGVGGAQAIATLAYGESVVPSIPACDIIVGPGNQWVTAAKSLVSNTTCAIDMLAGPSECLVVADDTADAGTIAADLLAQAEHDVSAVPILVTTSSELIDKVNAELESQLETLSTREVANESVSRGFAVMCPDMQSCVSVTNDLAPEHLEVMVEDSKSLSSSFDNYGAMFIGRGAAEVFGDYGAGPNHVLPTGGTGRYSGGLSVHTFLRIRTWMRIDSSTDAKELITNSAAMARIEGLEGHARAAEKRLELL